MKKIIHLMLLFTLLLTLAAACTPKATPAPTRPPATAVAPTATKAPEVPAWQKKWDETLVAAKKEGSLTIYGELVPELRDDLIKAFNSKYGISLDVIVGKSNEMAARWDRENTAGIHAVDIFHMGGGTSILTMKPKGAYQPMEPFFILPEVTDPKGWRDGKVDFLDADKMVVPLIAGWTSYTARNTDLVPQDVNSYKDLLKPEWKGKILLYDPFIPGAAAGWATFMLTTAFPGGLAEGTQFLKDLAATDPDRTRDVRLQVEQVAKGKYAIGLGAQHASVSDFKEKGAPITINRFKEGGNINPGSGCMEVAANAPHPNAAAVYVNFILGKEGQKIIAKGFGAPPARMDVSIEGLGIDETKIARPQDKAAITDEEFYKMQGKAMAIAKEIWGIK
ncbi:MAG: ABC transporter substrate-binding protein [Dehalococcoidia bacterium]|nr:ABC transporter substrate-binding protein [Dehalococcoidia bacterium]